MLTIKNILSDISYSLLFGSIETEIKNIQFDSRKVEEGDLFVAVKGFQTDGHQFVLKAVKNGASAVVVENNNTDLPENITVVKVENSANALGIMASNFYGNPSSHLKLVGVTGTNGKTTTVTLLYQLFEKLGYKSGLLSTIQNCIHKTQIPATHTTPDPIQLNKLLAEMIKQGCDYCFMEVSSHAAHQQRIAGLTFVGGVFSNITQDHLDYHKTFSEYIKAKKMFFDTLGKDAFALVNADDKNSKIMLQNTAAKHYSFGLKSMASFRARVLEPSIDGMLVSFDNAEVWTRFIGSFNAYNLLSVYAVAIILNQNKNEVLTALSNLEPVRGRFQYIKSNDGKIAIVDYAHTPDALDNVLKVITEISEHNNKIITVVGAGGNRDKTKRPLMAEISARFSNQLILTSDNPRNEKPEDIIEDMKKGVLPPLDKKILVIENRKEAIKTACMLAQSGDIILVAGKGHETYQEINGVKHHFDDTEVIKEIFELN